MAFESARRPNANREPLRPTSPEDPGFWRRFLRPLKSADINPAKPGCYVAGSGHAIIAPAGLVSRQVANVILMNPNYAKETLQRLEAEQCPATLLDWS